MTYRVTAVIALLMMVLVGGCEQQGATSSPTVAPAPSVTATAVPTVTTRLSPTATVTPTPTSTPRPSPSPTLRPPATQTSPTVKPELMAVVLHGHPEYPRQVVIVLRATGFIPGETVRVTLTSPQGEQSTGQAVADETGAVVGDVLLGPTAEVLGNWQLELAGKNQTHRGTVVVERPLGGAQ